MELSNRVRKIKQSATLAIAAQATLLKNEGKNVLSLSAGEPDFDTPDYIKEAAYKAIHDGFTKYTAVGGTPGLKKAISDKHKKDNNLEYAMNQIVVSCGGKQACYNLCQVLLNSEDEVIIPAPYWVSYPDMVLLADGSPVILETTAETSFKITASQLEASITPKTKLIFLNSPSNPSGQAYTKAELEKLGEVLRKHPNIIIATDDMYEKILWREEPFSNIINACPDLYGRTVVIHAVSKTYSMTGWRIGWACGSKALITAMTDIQSQSTSNPTSIAQVAAEAALKGSEESIKKMLGVFKKRHDFLVNGLNKISGIHCLPSDGTFYAFPNVEGLINRLNMQDDIKFSEFLLKEKLVALVPGSAFGAKGHLRLSFATHEKVIEECLERMGQL